MLYLLLPVHLQNYLVQLCLNLFADFYQLIGMKKKLNKQIAIAMIFNFFIFSYLGIKSKGL